MAIRVVLGARRLRRDVPLEPGPTTRRRVSHRVLVAAKAAALIVIAVVVGARLLYPPLPKILVNEVSGFEVRFPAAWHAGQWSVQGAEACVLRSDAEANGQRMPPRPTTGCRVALERLLPSDFEAVCRILGGVELARDWACDETAKLARVAAYLGMHGPGELARVERLRMAGRPALMLTAPRYDGWGSVVLACSDDITLLHIYFPTIDERRRLWPTWRAMVRSVRLRGTAVPVGATWIPPDPQQL